jgi:hypothetical protein
MFCTTGLVFDDIEGVRSRFHILCVQTHFRRYRGRRVPFSCFVSPYSYSAVLRASGSVFMFCALVLVFEGTEGLGSPFRILRARTHFRRYRGRRVPFSCFALPDTFSTVQRASGPFFLFCAPGLILAEPRGSGSRFKVLRPRTHFRRYRVRRVSFSCFALPDSFLAVTRALGPVFMFCAPVLVFDDTEGVRSHFHVFRLHTHFRRYRGGRVSFSCFASPRSFSVVPRASDPIFLFCALGFVFGSLFTPERSKEEI